MGQQGFGLHGLELAFPTFGHQVSLHRYGTVVSQITHQSLVGVTRGTNHRELLGIFQHTGQMKGMATIQHRPIFWTNVGFTKSARHFLVKKPHTYNGNNLFLFLFNL
jgi:hypothetical protein